MNRTPTKAMTAKNLTVRIMKGTATKLVTQKRPVTAMNRRRPKSASRNQMLQHLRILDPVTIRPATIRHVLVATAGQARIVVARDAIVEEIEAATVAEVDAADVGDVVVVAVVAVVEEIVALKVDETCLLRNMPRRRVTGIPVVTTIAGHPEIARRDPPLPWILGRMTLFCRASLSRSIARGLSKLLNQSENGNRKNGSRITNSRWHVQELARSQQPADRAALPVACLTGF
jgi:hypothetical protein